MHGVNNLRTNGSFSVLVDLATVCVVREFVCSTVVNLFNIAGDKLKRTHTKVRPAVHFRTYTGGTILEASESIARN